MNLIIVDDTAINLDHLVRAEYLPGAAGLRALLKLTLTSLELETSSDHDGAMTGAASVSQNFTLRGTDADAVWDHLNRAAIVFVKA